MRVFSDTFLSSLVSAKGKTSFSVPTDLPRRYNTVLMYMLCTLLILIRATCLSFCVFLCSQFSIIYFPQILHNNNFCSWYSIAKCLTTHKVWKPHKQKCKVQIMLYLQGTGLSYPVWNCRNPLKGIFSDTSFLWSVIRNMVGKYLCVMLSWTLKICW